MRSTFFKGGSAVVLLFAVCSAFSADAVMVDTSQALGPLEYDDPVVRDVACFDGDEECYYVVTGSLQQNSLNKHYVSLWKPTGKSGLEKLAALPVGDNFFRLVSQVSGQWLSLLVETAEAPPSVFLFNTSDKTFIDVTDAARRHGAIESLKSAKVTVAGALVLLYETSGGCCELYEVEVKSGKVLVHKKLKFAPGQQITPLDFDVFQNGYALVGALSDTTEQIGAVGVSVGKSSDLITLQADDRYYYSVMADGSELYAAGTSTQSGRGVLSVFRAKTGEKPELVADVFSKSAGSSALAFGHLCGPYFYEAFTDQKMKPYREFGLLLAPIEGGAGKAGSSDYIVSTSSPRVFKSVIPYMQRDQVFVVVNAVEFDEVTRGYTNRIYRKEVAEFALCAND